MEPLSLASLPLIACLEFGDEFEDEGGGLVLTGFLSPMPTLRKRTLNVVTLRASESIDRASIATGRHHPERQPVTSE